MTDRNYDEIVIQLRKADAPVGTIRMSMDQIELLMTNHEQPLGDVLELMVKTLESEPKPETNGN